MNKFLLFALVSLACAAGANAQGVGFDSKYKSIFSYYTSDNKLAIQTSSSTPVSVYKTVARGDSVVKSYPNIVPQGDPIPTVTKQHLWLYQASLLTSDGNSYASFTKIRPGIGLAFGYQNAINTVSHLDVIGGANTWGINGIFNLNNIDLYNTNTNREESRLPVTYGLEANYNHLFPHRNDAKFYWLLSLTASLYHTWNDDVLLSYQNLDAATISNSVVAFDNFRGRYGDFKNNVTNGRFSAATPLYWWYLNLIPFAELNYYSNAQRDYHAGAFLLILPNKISATNYSIPTSLGVGVDWIHSDGKFSSANFIITGTFEFK